MKKYIKIYAGLGNQIFQYAYGLYLQQQGDKVTFLLQKNTSPNSDITDIFDFDSSHFFIATNFIQKICLTVKKIYAKYILGQYYSGFYQKHLIPDSVPLSLTFKREKQYQATSLYKKISEYEAVSLHIRGGDYIGLNAFSDVCTSAYYKRAIACIQENIQNPHFFVFTNDSKITESLLLELSLIKDIDYTLVYNSEYKNDPGFDLYLMSQCKHNIIANSTFSWWGAYMNVHPEKIVVAPQNWLNSNFVSEVELIQRNKILIPSWIKK
jgi:hypothetical protein